MIRPKIFKGIIEFNKLIATETYHTRIRPQLEEVFDFEPGQFITITVGTMIKRSYSVGSLPKQNYIDLVVDTKIGGPGSQFFMKAQAGQDVELLGPLGTFICRDSERPLMFWATGTGIVPFMAMIENQLTIVKTNKHIVLNIGFRYQEAVVADEQFTRLAKDHTNFDYNLFLSRPPENWTGRSGRITEYLHEGQNISGYDHYLCGAKDMIDDVSKQLIENGTPKEQIYFEKY